MSRMIALLLTGVTAVFTSSLPAEVLPSQASPQAIGVKTESVPKSTNKDDIAFLFQEPTKPEKKTDKPVPKEPPRTQSGSTALQA